MLISAKINPSRTPTKMVGSAAGNKIFQNCWVGLRLKLRPTLTSTLRGPAMRRSRRAAFVMQHVGFLVLHAAARLFAQVAPDFRDVAAEGHAADDFRSARTLSLIHI